MKGRINLKHSHLLHCQEFNLSSIASAGTVSVSLFPLNSFAPLKSSCKLFVSSSSKVSSTTETHLGYMESILIMRNCHHPRNNENKVTVELNENVCRSVHTLQSTDKIHSNGDRSE